MEFLSLPDEKLKNKVVCDFHFKENFFMNFKREKLNKTNAVPTIYVTDEKEIDLMEAPTDWVEVNNSQANLQETSTQKNIDIDEMEDEMVEFDVQLSDNSPPAKKAIIVMQNQPVKILNIEAVPKAKIIESTPKNILPTVPSSSSAKAVQIVPFISPPQGYSIRRISPKKMKRTREISENNEEDIPMVIIESESSTDEESNFKKERDEIKTILLTCMKDNAEIKDLLTAQQKTPNQESSNQNFSNTLQSNDVSNISQSHLNKVQLFNGIKRYLSPAMVALLRMDLFTSSAPRDYKADEKVICTEILQFGDEVYNFLLDEWRLRLPPKTTVEKWLKEKQLQDEDDAS